MREMFFLKFANRHRPSCAGSMEHGTQHAKVNDGPGPWSWCLPACSPVCLSKAQTLQGCNLSLVQV